MRFINPKTDLAFKKIFGSLQSKPLLLSFLNALLHQGQPVIIDLEILDPFLAPKIIGIKDTYVDVRALLEGGRHVIIEMQVLNVAGFEKRILYNAAKTYSTQLAVRGDYTSLNGVIALTITDFEMFPEWPEVQSAFALKEKQKLTDYPEGDLELVFVELPKFQKSLEQLESLADKWLYFLKEAPDLQMVPEVMGEVPEIREAFAMANEANMSREELEAQEKREIFIHDQRGAITFAVDKAVAKAAAEGHEEAMRKVARGLLGQMGREQIAQLTGLSLKALKELET